MSGSRASSREKLGLVSNLRQIRLETIRPRYKLAIYVVAALTFALIASSIFGSDYDAANQKLKGAARRLQKRKAPTSDATIPSASFSQDGQLKDPYANRPRIRTRNGHLVIEASQDKNIDFRTSGSRGTVTVNGFKLDQLVSVARALENSSGSLKSAGDAGGPQDYEKILATLFSSSERLSRLEQKIKAIVTSVGNLDELLTKLKKQSSRRLQQVSDLSKAQEILLSTLKKNDCFENNTGQPVCKNGATCVDTYDSFTCLCPPQFEGRTCEQDVDECTKFRGTDLGCQNGAKCVNTIGGYQCECSPQYHGVHCTEQHDDCSLSSSRSLCGNGKCINLARNVPNQARYECLCDQGWTTDGVNPACTIDVNECLAGQLDNSSLNPNSLAVFRSLAWSGPAAAYPCSQNPYVECVNLPGSFQCGPCPPGYTGNGRVCKDVNECAQDNGGCSTYPLVECFNLPGTRQCGPCPPGYSGDGITCSRVLACSTGSNGGCHPNARCVDTPNLAVNSRICICSYPYQGDGVGELGCRLMSLPGPTPRGGNQTSPGSTESSRTDDCSPNPCLNGAKCQLTSSSFECLCSAGWHGRWCEDSTICGAKYYTSAGELTFPSNGTFNDVVKQNQIVESSGDRKISCYWSISVVNNQSVKLTLSDMYNKFDPSKRVQMFLASNGTTSLKSEKISSGGVVTRTSTRAAPGCAEYLDVVEVQSDLVLNEFSLDTDRLLARFCTAPKQAPVQMTQISRKEPVNLIAETNTVMLLYSFSATRTQFAEPSLGFSLSWTKYDPPCGGELPVSESGSISSPKFPEFYPAGIECRYVIRVGQGRRIRIQFGELNLLATQGHTSSQCTDSLVVIDGSIGSHRPILFKHCANNSTIMGRAQSPPSIVSSSSTVEVILTSRFESTTPLMKPNQKRGFYLTYASEPAVPGCGGLFTAKSSIIRSSDYERSSSSVTSSPLNPYELSMAHQMSAYFDMKNSLPIGRWLSSADSPQGSYSHWYRTRCEYEIRPADQGRDHHISIDWIEMPTDQTIDAAALNNWSRRLACTRGHLTIYDGNPMDGSNRTAVARFCSGDRYNSSLPQLEPIVSTGHVLYLVYESLHANPMSEWQGDKSNSGTLTNIVSRGFRLKYSTICTAIYYKLDGKIRAELDPQVSECIYHIILPPNNTISLVIEPNMSSTMILADGSCAAQAIFMDGAIQRTPEALVNAERQLRTYSFNKTNLQVAIKIASDRIPPATRSGEDTMDMPELVGSGEFDEQTESGSSTPETSAFNAGNSDNYWQYQSSEVHDIKEFEVCKSHLLSFDSVWNHLSLMFRLSPRAKTLMVDKARDSEMDTILLGSTSPAPSESNRVFMTVKYQAEPACGGIIKDPREGVIQLDESRQSAGLNGYPLTVSRFEQYHKEQLRTPCAWVVKNTANRLIRLEFVLPHEIVQRRYDDWLAWSTKMRKDPSTKKSDLDFNCSAVYQEMVEIYEPSLNRTQTLCPLDLLEANGQGHKWTSQSDTLLIRLRNTTLSANATYRLWPGRRPLGPNQLISVKYSMLNQQDTICGGKLIHDSGTITSPRFPFNYPSSASCVWIIQTNPQQQIRLNFTRFELEKQSNCQFDYLELRNGPAKNSPLIGRFCNQDLQSRVLVSQSNFLRLEFNSDAHLNRAGFQVHYDGAQTGCGGRLTSGSGMIDSPNYPLAYAHSSECSWTIEVSQGNRVHLSVVDLDLGSDDPKKCVRSVATGTVLGNYLEILDSSRSLGRFCQDSQLSNSNTSSAIISTSNTLTITYKSQALSRGRGFRLTYKTLCHPNTLIDFEGAIESPGYPANYESYYSCAWFVRGPIGSNLSLRIVDFELEERGYATGDMIDDTRIMLTGKTGNDTSKRRDCNDQLKIYAVETKLNMSSPFSEVIYGHSIYGGVETIPGKNSSMKLIRSLCGTYNDLSESERSIEINAGGAFLVFTSDRSANLRGFRVEWQAKGCGGKQSGSHFASVAFEEPTGGHPMECLWTIDLGRKYSAIDFSLDSDMRSPNLLATNGSAKFNPCDDSSLTIYNGPTTDSPVLSQNCDAEKSRESFTATSAQILVRFFTRGGQRKATRFFSLFGSPIIGHSCMSSSYDITSPYNQQSGSQESPNYPELYEARAYDCEGYLIASQGRLMVKIDELDIPIAGYESSTSLLDEQVCKDNSNYLSIRTASSTRIQTYYCGKFDPAANANRSVIVFEQEAGRVSFRTRTAALQGKWRLTYRRLCGSKIEVYKRLNIATPNYPNRPNWVSQSPTEASENVCIWRFNVREPRSYDFNWYHPTLDRQEPRSQKLHITISNFIQPPRVGSKQESASSDCIRIYEGVDISLRQYKFNLTDLDANIQPKVKICDEKSFNHQNLNYISQGAEVTVMTSGTAIAKFTVSQTDDHCGSEHHVERAELSSPNYPLPYAPNADCSHFIMGAPGTRVRLNFDKLDLPEPELVVGEDGDASTTSCDNTDHVEIRQLSALTTQRVRSQGYGLTSSSARWDDLYYLLSEEMSFLRGNMTKLSSKELRFMELAKIHYSLVDTRPSSRQFFKIDKNSLPLVDFYEHSKLIGRFCGKKAPRLADSLRDDILIRFRSHELGGDDSKRMPKSRAKKQPTGFLLSYTLDYGGLIKILSSNSTGETDTQGLIGSPRFPSKFMSNKTIKWTFETAADSIIEFDLISMDLGRTTESCQDTLSIFDGLNAADSRRLSHMCGLLSFRPIYSRHTHFSAQRAKDLSFAPSRLAINLAHDESVRTNLIRRVRSTTNVASIVYSNFNSEGHFLLKYRSVQKSSLSPNETDVDITDDGSVAIDTATTKDSALQESRRNPSKFCSTSYRLSYGTNSSQRVRLSSPNWPNEPPHDTECHWLVYTLENAQISLEIDPPDASAQAAEFTDLLQYDGKDDFCLQPKGSGLKKNFIAVYDGASELSPLIGRYCLPARPIQLKSTGRNMFIRYVHADRYQMNQLLAANQSQSSDSHLLAGSLFRARASIGQCGGQYHVVSGQTIEDRPQRLGAKNYGNNLDCRYFLFAGDSSSVLVLNAFQPKFDLSSEPTNANCTVGDYLEIRDLPVRGDMFDTAHSASGRSLGRFCAGRPLNVSIESSGSALSLLFHTDQSGVSSGFSLYVHSNRPRVTCPLPNFFDDGRSPISFGRLMSPNWPHGHPGKRRCRYLLVAPANQSILVHFIRLRRPKAPTDEFPGTSTSCIDNFYYLDDDEADGLRDSSDSLKELYSISSGLLLRELVQKVPCRVTARSTNVFYSYTKATANLVDDNEALKSINSDEYQRLLEAGPPLPYTIKSRSHKILFEYEANSLLPDEGFLAAFRVVDRQESRCGGQVQPRVLTESERESSLNSAVSSSSQSDSQPSNAIDTEDLFRSLSRTSSSGGDPSDATQNQYAQCEWQLELTGSSAQNSHIFHFLVFQYAELPSRVPGTWYLGQRLKDRLFGLHSNDACGLTRFYVNSYNIQSVVGCGNVTGRLRYVQTVDSRSVGMRVKRPTVNSTTVAPDSADQQPFGGLRGIRAYYFANNCPDKESQADGGKRIVSHVGWPNASYAPGICRWLVRVPSGGYSLWLERANFRPPPTSNSSESKRLDCDPNDPNLDYLEIDSSDFSGQTDADDEAPVVTRYCYHNQQLAQRISLNVTFGVGLRVSFVAGLRQLEQNIVTFPKSDAKNSADPFGFALQIVRVRNETEGLFCRRGPHTSIFEWIELEDIYHRSIARSFMYPKNTHCVVELALDFGFRFNLTFKGMFDLEQSSGCQNDYVQIDDIGSAPTSNATSTTTPRPSKASGGGERSDVGALRIGRWCGRNRPTGYFVSQSERIRITFHSNERVEGKGFALVYRRMQSPLLVQVASGVGLLDGVQKAISTTGRPRS